MPNALLKRLADDPEVKRVHYDREITADNYPDGVHRRRRACTRSYGYNGAGIGVAVIDSGITPWHDDLTAVDAVSVRDQRVTAFVDFVNGRTTPYDDYGHGTHVAGIIAGNGYDSTGSQRGRRAGRHRSSRSRCSTPNGHGHDQLHHRGARLGRREPRSLQHPRRQHVGRRRRFASPTRPTR